MGYRSNDNRKLTNGFYDTAMWHKTAKYIREKHYYICQRCGEKGNIVHHKNPLTPEDYINRPADKCYGEDNLELLCFECHEKEHNRMSEGIRDNCYFDEMGNIQSKEIK